MLDMWRKITAKFPEYLFGYNQDNGMVTNISVMSKKGHLCKRESMEYGLEPKAYLVAYLQILQDFGENITKKGDQDGEGATSHNFAG